MTLLRAGYRTLLASYFVSNGVKAVRDPLPLVPVAEPLAQKLVPMAKQYAPASVAGYVPEDTATLVRVNGAVQLAGGLALASGRGRRLGALLLALSLIPSTLAKYPFWTRTEPDEKADDRNQFLKNTSLLGGVLLAAADTEGRPSLAWRASKGTQAIARDTRQTRKRVAKSTSELTEHALGQGAALVGAVVATSRAAKRRAANEAKRSALASKKARKDAGRKAKQARKDAGRKAKDARAEAAARQKQEAARRKQEATQRKQEAARRKQEATQRKAAAAQLKEARKAEKLVERNRSRARSNVKLGEN